MSSKSITTNSGTDSQSITPKGMEDKSNVSLTDNENSLIATDNPGGTSETELGKYDVKSQNSGQPPQAEQKSEANTQEPQNRNEAQNSPANASNPNGTANGNTPVVTTPTTNQASQADNENSPKTTNIKGLKAGMGVSWGVVAAGIAAAAVTLVLSIFAFPAIPLYAILIPAGVALLALIPAIITTITTVSAIREDNIQRTKKRVDQQVNEDNISPFKNEQSVNNQDDEDNMPPLFTISDDNDQLNISKDPFMNDFEEAYGSDTSSQPSATAHNSNVGQNPDWVIQPDQWPDQNPSPQGIHNNYDDDPVWSNIKKANSKENPPLFDIKDDDNTNNNDVPIKDFEEAWGKM